MVLLLETLDTDAFKHLFILTSYGNIQSLFNLYEFYKLAWGVHEDLNQYTRTYYAIDSSSHLI